MINKLQAVADRYEELCARSEQPDFYADPKKAAKLLREKNQLEPIVEAYHAYGQACRDMEDAQELMADPEMKELCQETYLEAKQNKEELYARLQILLLPKDPNDDKSVIVEIRGGVGGEESALFAHSLFRMYSMYAARMGWRIELLNYNETELGGVKEADFIVDVGPGAGSHGGEIVATGNLEDICKEAKSVTGQYLTGVKKIPVPSARRQGNGNYLEISGATENNLKEVDVSVPLGTLTCVTGVSGSGKSSLVNEVLNKTLLGKLNHARTRPGACRCICGMEHLDKVIDIDQSPIGRTPRSNPLPIQDCLMISGIYLPLLPMPKYAAKVPADSPSM